MGPAGAAATAAALVARTATEMHGGDWRGGGGATLLYTIELYIEVDSHFGCWQWYWNLITEVH